MLRVLGFFLVAFLAFGLFVQPVQAERMYPKKVDAGKYNTVGWF